MALTAAHLNAEVILVVTVQRQCSNRYIISITPPPPPPNINTPFPPFSPSLISLMVSVEVKHHVYLLIPMQLSGLSDLQQRRFMPPAHCPLPLLPSHRGCVRPTAPTPHPPHTGVEAKRPVLPAHCPHPPHTGVEAKRPEWPAHCPHPLLPSHRG